MRKSQAATADTKAAIVTEASRLFREGGFDAVGVDRVMKAVGLTHGGFYSHFSGKNALVAEAVEAGFAAHRDAVANQSTLHARVTAYLSPGHRDDKGAGCCLAALGSDMGRGDNRLRKTVTAYLRDEFARLTAQVRGATAARRRRRAVATLAGLVGALTLARATDDPDLSDEILAATRAELLS